MALRQTVALFLVKVNDKVDGGHSGVSVQKPYPARFDHAQDCRRCGGPEQVVLAGQFRLIIRYQSAAHRHKLQSQRGFSAAGCASDQHTLAIKRDGRGVQAGAVGHRRSDRQTHDKSCAKRFGRDIGIRRTDVFSPDHAAMGLDNLL